MGDSNDRIATTWHRAVKAGVIVLLAGVSAAAAAFNGAGAPQQPTEKREVVIETTSGPGMGQSLADAAAGVPVFKQVRFENVPGAPIAISSAEIKKIPAAEVAKALGAEGRLRKFELQGEIPPPDAAGATEMKVRRPFPDTDADGNATILLITLQNVSARTVSGYQIGGKIGPEDDVFFMFQKPFEPGGTFTVAMPVGEPLVASDSTVLGVRGAQYDDGSTWGEWKSDPALEFRKRAQ